MEQGNLAFGWIALCGILGLVITRELRFYMDDPRKMRITKPEVIKEIKTPFPARVVRFQQQEEKAG